MILIILGDPGETDYFEWPRNKTKYINFNLYKVEKKNLIEFLLANYFSTDLKQMLNKNLRSTYHLSIL